MLSLAAAGVLGTAPPAVAIGEAGALPAQARPPQRYSPPVPAPVIDPFRLPDGPYGAGNRGLEYRTRPGEVVRAIGTGTVAFAGQVAGRLVVSIDHPDGLRSSLVGLAAITVVPGRSVVAGEPVGLASARLHLGVRRLGRYLDPASLFAARGPARLVPWGAPAGFGPAGRRH